MGFAVAVMAITVAVTPLVLSLIAARDPSSPAGLIVGSAIAWLLAVVAYRGLSNTYEHQRRRALREEIAELRQARNEATSAFQRRSDRSYRGNDLYPGRWRGSTKQPYW